MRRSLLNILTKRRKSIMELATHSEPNKQFHTELNSVDIVREFYSNKAIDNWTDNQCQLFIETVKQFSIKDIIVLLSDGFRAFDIPVGDVPQFSSLSDCFIVPKCLIESGSEAVSWEDLGYLISGINKKEAAHRKYGENHGKMAEIFGLAR